MNIRLKTQGAAASRPLAGKVSLVTGSTSGIGLGIARALAEAGSAVVLNGLGVAVEINRTKEQLAADFGVEPVYPRRLRRPSGRLRRPSGRLRLTPRKCGCSRMRRRR